MPAELPPMSPNDPGSYPGKYVLPELGLNRTTEYSYELLTGHRRTDGSFKTTEQLQTEYVRLTDELIRQMTEGVPVEDPQTGERQLEKPDFVVYLDKSARPVSWLVKELWPTLAQAEDGSIPKMPETRFVNIDREQWVNSIDPEGRGLANVDEINKSVIRSLRSIFLANPKDRRNGLTEDIDTAPTQFDGKTVLIIDEVLASGRTLRYAEDFFRRAFPEAKIATSYWMGKVNIMQVKGAVGTIVNADLPVWYRQNFEPGRGVGNRNEEKSFRSNNPTQRLGAWFLSTRFLEPDSLSQKLRNEIHQLGNDVRRGNVFIEPSTLREEADFDRLALGLNHLRSLAEYRTLKARLRKQK